jgi:hypothetical protein
MQKIILFLGVSLISLSSCNKDDEQVVTPPAVLTGECLEDKLYGTYKGGDNNYVDQTDFTLELIKVSCGVLRIKSDVVPLKDILELKKSADVGKKYEGKVERTGNPITLEFSGTDSKNITIKSKDYINFNGSRQ